MMPAAPDSDVMGENLFKHQSLSYRVGWVAQGQRVSPRRWAVQVFKGLSQRDMASGNAGFRQQQFLDISTDGI